MADSSANEASLTILGGPQAGKHFVVEDSVDNIVIGSDPSCRFQIDLPGVSPVHARIWIDPQGVTVYETNSPRGLYVNDDRVVAQASLRNGDILWLGTPGDEDVVMIQCRFPNARAEPRAAFVPAPPAEDAPDETVALGALPVISRQSGPEVPSQPEPDAPERTQGAGPSAGPAPAPPTEVLVVDDEFAQTQVETPPSYLETPSLPAKFEVDFTKPDLPIGFEEEVEATVAPVLVPEARPSPPPPPMVAAPPPPPPGDEIYIPPPPPPRAETPLPQRAKAPPAPPRRSAAPAAAPTTAPAEGSARGMPAAVRWGGLAAGLAVAGLGAYLGVRMLRGSQPAEPAAPGPPATSVPAPPPSVAPQTPAEPTPEAEAPAGPQPIEEEVTIVTPPPPTTAATQAAARSERLASAPPPTPRPARRAADTPSQGSTAPAPPAADAPPSLGAQVASVLGRAESAAQARNFEAAIRDYDEVLRLDAQNNRAAQGKAEAQAAAASLKRAFAAGRTTMSGKQAKAGDLGGFDTAGVKVAKVPDYSGRIEFEVSPTRVLPGDTYTVRIFLVNDGKKTFDVVSVTATTTTNGVRAGGAVPVRSRELEPRDRMLLDERTAEWPAGTTSWTLEALVQTDRDASFTNRLNWR